MCRSVEIYHRIAVAIDTMSDFYVAAVHIGCGQRTIGHISHFIDIIYQVSTRYRIAVFIGEFINGIKSSLAQVGLERFIVRSKTGIMAIYRQGLKQLGTLQDSSKVAELLTRLKVFAHHLACKCIVVGCVYVIATIEDARCQHKLQQQ